MRHGDNNISLAVRFSPACACTTGGAAVRTQGETALTQMQVNRMKVFYGVTNGQAVGWLDMPEEKQKYFMVLCCP